MRHSFKKLPKYVGVLKGWTGISYGPAREMDVPPGIGRSLALAKIGNSALEHRSVQVSKPGTNHIVYTRSGTQGAPHERTLISVLMNTCKNGSVVLQPC